MSLPVDLDALRDRVAEYGEGAFVITVNEDGTSHVVSVIVRHEGEQLVASAGRRTRANLEHNPALTLLWPPRRDPAYSMIVDATVGSSLGNDGEIGIEPHSAVLHRVAGADDDRPTCLPIANPAGR